MKSNRHPQVFITTLLFIYLLLLVACQPGPSAAVANFDYQKAAEVNAARWQAMGEYYEEAGLLAFDYERAADVHAARWMAMGKFYEKAGLLNFDYERAAEVQASRWMAMADFYRNAGLLNESAQ
jgi:hypothetical protein